MPESVTHNPPSKNDLFDGGFIIVYKNSVCELLPSFVTINYRLSTIGEVIYNPVFSLVKIFDLHAPKCDEFSIKSKSQTL